MKRIYAMAAVLAILAFGAAAQEITAQQVEINVVKAGAAQHQADLEQMLAKVKVGNFKGLVMGVPVKGAPYSAEEITEATQVLGNGTTIRHQDKTSVCRDGEGRVRRESPDQISISDPVAGVSYLLDPKTMTARKMTVSIVTSTAADGAMSVHVTVNGPGPGAGMVHAENQTVVKGQASAAAKTVVERTATGKSESLGKQMIEGVQSDGTRTTSTIEAGAIGNDRPIQTVSERWYSPELQTVVMTKRSDPRTGDETFRLANVRRGEPGAYLFQVPAGYQIVESK
jgi:hypothetical protein